MTDEKTVDRFDLEQGIQQCWGITDDIMLLLEQEAGPDDFANLASFYNFKFEKLWKTFEAMVANKQFVETSQ
jgi:flagellin-specific chaperone FliS